MSKHTSRAVVGTLLVLYLIGTLSLGPVVAADSTASVSNGEHIRTSSHRDLGSDLLNDTTNTTENTTSTVENTTENTTDGTVNSTDSTLDNTTDAVNGTVDNTTDTVSGTDSTFDNTTDTVNDTHDNTTDTVNDTDSTLDNTTDTVNDTLDNTTDTVDGAAGTIDDTLAGLLEGIPPSIRWNGTVRANVENGSAPKTTTVGDSRRGSHRETTQPARVTTTDRNASAAGTPTGGDGGNTPLPAPAVVGLGAVLVGAAGASALSSGGTSALQSPGFARTSATSVRNAATGARKVLSGTRTALSGLGDKLWRIGAVLRYSRWDDSDPLEHDARRDIFETVEDAPGIYLSKIDERTDRSLSSLRHHLRILEEEGLITTEKVRGKRRYFPVERGASDPALIAALDDPATEAILTTLADDGPATGGDLADELDRDPSTVSHHLSRLEEEGLVERERDGRAVVNSLSESAALALSDAPTANGEVPTPADD
ncbi:MAG: metalloregulator ArsR/SmtB family transcription factor [Halapricum sp.]